MTVRIITGDCRDVLAALPGGSVQCCVTSPPYYGLRDYGMAEQIGQETSPTAYIAELVAVFREVFRVLADDGTLWLNLGDSYAGGRAGPQGEAGELNVRAAGFVGARRSPPAGAGRPKDRLMIPARVALALQADGWYLRDEIVWHKPRATPAPVKDRTVSAHEMLYLLTKRPHYFYDYLAIEEPSAYAGLTRKAGKAFRDLEQSDPNAARKRPGADRGIVVRDTRRKRSVWSVSPSPYKDAHFATFPPALIEPCILAGSRPGDTILDPFGGAGTTGVVAAQHGRGALLIEQNPDYAALARRRIDGPTLADMLA